MLPDAGESKVNACVENAFQVWEDGKDTQATQLIFCDLSTPKTDGTFNVYDDVRNKLVERGIPKEQIAFIHEYNTELKKAELFAKVRAGQVRILMGSLCIFSVLPYLKSILHAGIYLAFPCIWQHII